MKVDFYRQAQIDGPTVRRDLDFQLLILSKPLDVLYGGHQTFTHPFVRGTISPMDMGNAEENYLIPQGFVLCNLTVILTISYGKVEWDNIPG